MHGWWTCEYSCHRCVYACISPLAAVYGGTGSCIQCIHGCACTSVPNTLGTFLFIAVQWPVKLEELFHTQWFLVPTSHFIHVISEWHGGVSSPICCTPLRYTCVSLPVQCCNVDWDWNPNTTVECNLLVLWGRPNAELCRGLVTLTSHFLESGLFCTSNSLAL